jgi:hypothetical protein
MQPKISPAAKREHRPVAPGRCGIFTWTMVCCAGAWWVFPKYANKRRQRPHLRRLDFYRTELARKHANTLGGEFGVD